MENAIRTRQGQKNIPSCFYGETKFATQVTDSIFILRTVVWKIVKFYKFYANKLSLLEWL